VPQFSVQNFYTAQRWKKKHFSFEEEKFKEVAVVEGKMKLRRNTILEQGEGNFALLEVKLKLT
jgi:hypothetical protein